MAVPVVKVDARVFTKAMEGFGKQVPYAIARALTSTALDSKTVLQARLPSHFTIRSDWERKGIRIDAAKKTNLTATVGSIHDYMDEQAVGGTKKARGKYVGIPMEGRGLPRATEKSPTRPSKWPGAYLAKGKAFVGSPFGGDDAVWQRVRKGRGKKAKDGLRLLYLMQESVKVPARWPIRQEVEEVVAARWADHTVSAIREALDTAR